MTLKTKKVKRNVKRPCQKYLIIICPAAVQNLGPTLRHYVSLILVIKKKMKASKVGDVGLA